MKPLHPKTHERVATEASCYDMALDRLRYVFERFDQITVGFSGGKDSTACLQLALTVAAETGRLPLDVFTFDEEVIPPETVDYMARVAARPDVRFHWYCVPMRHRNACSLRSPYWYPWAPEDRDRWIRPLPATAITDYPGLHRGDIETQMPFLYPPSKGTCALILGIRTAESIIRLRSIARKSGFKAFMAWHPAPHITKVYPIYDWATEDVWRAPAILGWDYNRAYDQLNAAGIPKSVQRCAPAFGEQSIQRLYAFKVCWPELWAAMTARVPGVATAGRYANTELYGKGVKAADLPAGLTWRQWTIQTLQALGPEQQREAAHAIQTCIRQHHKRAGADAPIPDAISHPKSGYCWKILFIAAKVGGDKFDRQQQKMRAKALAALMKSEAAEAAAAV
jgi:predicted phosphoadenosine phosphosulfate sulfurtransferase